MSATPLLRHLIERTGEGAGSYLLVLEGDGMDDLPPEIATTEQSWSVGRAATEVGLRRLLWRANGAPLVAVVPSELATRLPADLVQSARNQRVQALQTSEVLSVLLGRKVETTDEGWFNRLVLDNVEPLVQQLNRRTLPTQVSRRDLGELLVEITLAQEIRGATPAELLARWILDPPQLQPGHLELLQTDALIRLQGDGGHVLAWALERPEKDLRTVLVTGLALTVRVPIDQVPQRIWAPFLAANRLRDHFGRDQQWLRATLERLAVGAVAVLGKQAQPFLEQAEKKARDHFPMQAVATSPVLPHAFDLQAHALAHQAATGNAVLATELQQLAAHHYAPLRTRDLSLLKWMSRLSRYLAEPPEDPTTTGAWATRYAHSDAFADLAAGQLRRALGQIQTESLHDPAVQLLLRWEERRNGLNERFARFLATDWAHRLHDEVVPIHKISTSLLAPKLNAGKRVYLVVLDGCSVPIWHELLLELAEQNGIGLAPSTAGRVGLAALPSVTSHSRGALFLGLIPKDPLMTEVALREKEKSTDPGRLQQNPALKKWKRQLFLKGDLGTPAPLYGALKDDSIPLVAAVFNAVDDQISSHNTHASVRVKARLIQLFLPSLEKALDAGREVLITADHGHTPWLRGDGYAGKGTSARWTELAEGEDPPDGFLEIDTQDLGGSPGRKAFAWRMNTWLGSPQVGYHGGCSLEELVIPLTWLTRDGPPMLEPGWWHDLPHTREATAEGLPTEDDVPTEVDAPTHADAPTEIDAPTPAVVESAPPQLGLLDTSSRLASLLSHFEELGLGNTLASSLDDQEKAVLVLLYQNERASLRDIHQRIDKPLGRVNGWMNRLRKKLFKANAVVFEVQAAPDGSASYVYTGKRT